MCEEKSTRKLEEDDKRDESSSSVVRENCEKGIRDKSIHDLTTTAAPSKTFLKVLEHI